MGAVEAAVLGLVGVGGVAIGTGLYKLGTAVGALTATVKLQDERLDRIEQRQDDRDRSAYQRKA